MVSNEKWFGASAGFYNNVATQSLRITGNGYLNHEHTSAPTLDTKGTVAFWIKLNNNDDRNYVIQNYQANNNNGYMDIRFGGSVTNQGMHIGQYGRTPYTASSTDAKQRDFGAWYHCLVSFDSTSSTASERQMKIFINGTQVTSGTFGAISQNDKFPLTAQGSANGGVTIGRHVTVGYYIDAYFADFYVIDGQALTPDSFTEIKNGICIPKAYDGTYGNNGFRLEFKQTGTSADASGLGADTSGNGNHFTVNSLSAHDSNLPDSPENNFATLNLIHTVGSPTLSEGNLKLVGSGTDYDRSYGTIGITSGKWYAEFYYVSGDDRGIFGVVREDSLGLATSSNYIGSQANDYGIDFRARAKNNSSNLFNVTSFSTGDIGLICFDIDNGKLWFGRRDVSGSTTIWYDSSGNNNGDPSAGSNPTYTFTATGYTWFIGCHDYNGTNIIANFGQDGSFAGAITSQGASDSNGIGDFNYIESGFLALCSANLPDTTISPNQDTQADDHFQVHTFTGDANSTRTITGLNFQPDWLWSKARNQAFSHNMYDSSRGNDKGLQPNNTNAENTNDLFNGFTSDGYNITTDGTVGDLLNYNGGTYVNWLWKCSGTTPTKTYKVVVVSDSGNKFRFRNSADSATFAQSAVTLDLQELGTYTFDVSDSSMSGHALKFSTTSDGIHGGGSEYTTGVTSSGTSGQTGAYVQITVASSAPTLYYYCGISGHSGMGGQINTNSTFGSTNFDGSILSVVQTNETSGFSISKYTGTGSLATVGHGLGSTAQWVIIKKRSSSGNWVIGHHKNGFNGQLYFDSGAFSSNSGSFNNTAPTSTVVTINTDSTVNTSSATYVMYCFTEIEGYSKFGSFKGNGSSDGTFVFTGFRPAWILIKSSSHGEPWNLVDTKRDTFNVMGNYLQPNTSSAEGTLAFVDGLSNGFKLRSSGSGFNGSGYTFIYMCFAEQPFKFSNAR